MEKSINHNIMFLKKRAVPVTWKNAREEKETKALIRDLQDTLKAPITKDAWAWLQI